jgi:hypothetical protein
VFGNAELVGNARVCGETKIAGSKSVDQGVKKVEGCK